MTKLAASIMVRDLDQALTDAARAAEFGAELIEYRIDCFVDDPPAVTALVEGSPLPCIITCRPTWEGGSYDGDEVARLDLLERATAGVRQPAYLDFELAAYQRTDLARRRIDALTAPPGSTPAPGSAPGSTLGSTDKPGLILSTHDFSARPHDLYQKLEAMIDAPPCRVLKVAWQARSLRDNLEAFDVLRQQLKPTIALCMGEFGLPSRVLAKKFGALLSFAALDDAAATAPGQPTLADLKQLYRWDRIGRQTAVFGVIGYPVGHSLSPAIHNAGFEAVGFDGVYLPLPIPPDYVHFKATVAAWLDMQPLHFGGASVTIPHKQNLLRFVSESGGEVEPLAQSIGAANTLTRRADGSLYASNTDYAAALDAVCGELGIERAELAGKEVAVIGAGGAARAVVAGFAHYGAHVTIYNRTLSRAELIAHHFDDQPGSVRAADLDALLDANAAVFINCTPLGMHPEVDASPIPEGQTIKAWGPGVLVFDTIYNPAETRLLLAARAAGCATVAGSEMFVRQAAAQFEQWTGRPAPLEAFRRALSDRLG